MDLLPRVLVFQQGLGLLLTDDGGFDLRRVHVHVEFAANQKAHGGGKLGLGFEHLRRLFLDDEGAAETRRNRAEHSVQSVPSVISLFTVQRVKLR